MSINWLEPGIIEAIHEEQLAEHGGADGIFDSALLNSAVARPKQAVVYEEKTVFELAALLLVGLVKNHPFVDGNKRVGLVSAYTFLAINGYELVGPEEEAYLIVMDVASGKTNEEGLAQWFRNNAIPLSVGK